MPDILKNISGNTDKLHFHYKTSIMWKFHNFSITQILREINFEYSRSAKSTILTHLEAVNFDFYEILHFLKAEKHQIN